LTRGTARELGRVDINMNCIIPGITMTEGLRNILGFHPGMFEMVAGQTALGRNEEPGDLVGTTVFFASKIPIS